MSFSSLKNLTPREVLSEHVQAKVSDEESRELDKIVKHFASRGIKTSRSAVARAFIADGIAAFKEYSEEHSEDANQRR